MMSDAFAATRRCPRCKRDLPATLEHFRARRPEPLAFTSWCRACQCAHKRERRAAAHERARRELAQSETPGELWRPVTGAPYEVSDQGRGRRITPANGTRIGLVLRPALTRDGYHRVSLHASGRARYTGVHQLVAAAFLGPRPDGHEVNHKNGVKTDNRPPNLEYVTPAENQRHATAHGLRATGDRSGARRHPERRARGDRSGARLYPERLARGSANSAARLDEARVAAIRARYAAGGATYGALAAEFGVCRNAIALLVRRETWSHCP